MVTATELPPETSDRLILPILHPIARQCPPAMLEELQELVSMTIANSDMLADNS